MIRVVLVESVSASLNARHANVDRLEGARVMFHPDREGWGWDTQAGG
jgi:hypothetical protein